MIRRTLCEVMEVGECKPRRNNGIAFSAKVGNSQYFIMDNDLQNGLLLEIVDRYGADVSSLQSAEIAITTVRNAHDTNQRIEVWTVEFESFAGMKFVEIFQTNLSLLSKEEIPNFARIILTTTLVTETAKRSFWEFLFRVVNGTLKDLDEKHTTVYFYEEAFLGVGGEDCVAEDLGLPPETHGGKIAQFPIFSDNEQREPAYMF